MMWFCYGSTLRCLPISFPSGLQIVPASEKLLSRVHTHMDTRARAHTHAGTGTGTQNTTLSRVPTHWSRHQANHTRTRQTYTTPANNQQYKRDVHVPRVGAVGCCKTPRGIVAHVLNSLSPSLSGMEPPMTYTWFFNAAALRASVDGPGMASAYSAKRIKSQTRFEGIESTSAQR